MSSPLNEELAGLETNSTTNRGRPPGASKEDQMATYIENKEKLLNDKKMLKLRTAPIFDVMGKKLNMKSNAVHLAISRNMDAIFGSGNFELKIAKAVKPIDEDYTDHFYMDSDGSTLVIRNFSPITFDIVESAGKDRMIKRLREGWSDDLFEIIKNEIRNDCIYNFKRALLAQNEFSSEGTCSECGGKVHVSSSLNRTELQMQFTAGTGSHTHQKFRRMTPYRSKQFLTKLQNKTTYNVYHDQTQGISDDAKHLPRDFVSVKSLENIKYNYNKSKESPINELRIMKYSPEWDDAIKEISVNPFVVTFWSKQQIFFYAQKASEKGGPCVSLDATGSVILSNNLTSDIREAVGRDIYTPHVFLYLISIKSMDGNSVPVAQMLSSQQDSTRISYFFDRWCQDFKKPVEVVIDDSKAFKKSCSKSFAGCENIKEYIAKCFGILLHEEHPCLPDCFIRLDCSHFIHNLQINSIWHKCDKNAKRLYLCSIGVIMQCENFSEIGTILENMLILATGAIGSDESLSKLSELVQTHNTEIISKFNSTKNDEEDGLRDVFSADPYDNCTWFDRIFDGVKAKTPNEPIKKEPYFYPNLTTFLKKLFDDLPLWCPVMKPYFKSNYDIATSSDTEARFNVIKNVLFRNEKLPMKADTFVKTLLRNVNSIAKLANITHNVNIYFRIYEYFMNDLIFVLFHLGKTTKYPNSSTNRTKF